MERITFRQLQRLTVNEIERVLSNNGGILGITVDSQSRFTLRRLTVKLTNSDDDLTPDFQEPDQDFIEVIETNLEWLDQVIEELTR